MQRLIDLGIRKPLMYVSVSTWTRDDRHASTNPNHFDSKYPVSDRSRWSVSGLGVAPAALRFSLVLAETLLTRATTGHAHEYTSITLKPT